MTKREAEEDDGTKVHDIKFDAYGIMEDGVDESTDQQLAKLKPDSQKPEANHTGEFDYITALQNISQLHRYPYPFI